MFDLFSMEADNDDIDIDVSKSVTINDETAVDEAGSDSEVTDVSNISEKTEAHNEAASAGGVSTGNNVEEISMDPVAASESYIFKQFGLSVEDLDEAVSDTIKESEEIPDVKVDEDDSDLADTAVPSGGEVVTAYENNLDETHVDNAGLTPEVEPEDYPENADAPGTIVTEILDTEDSIESLLFGSLGFTQSKKNSQSSEGFVSTFIKNPAIKAYFDSKECAKDEEKFKAKLKKDGCELASRDDFMKQAETKIKLNMNNKRLFMLYKSLDMIVTHNDVTYIMVPHNISIRSGVTLWANIITIPISLITNLLKHQMKVVLFPIYKKPNGEVCMKAMGVAQCTVKKEDFKNFESIAKTANEIIRTGETPVSSKESVDNYLDYCYFN